jgi:hypothetical protein
MCEPATIATLAFTAVSSLASIKAQSDQVDTENARQTENYRLQQIEADRAYAIQANQETSALMQQDIANSKELTESQRQKTAASSTSIVSAGEAGVSGLSLDMLLGDFERSEANYADATKQQFEFDSQAVKDRMDGLSATRDSRINAARPKLKAKPSYLTVVGNVAGAYVGSKGGQAQMNSMFKKPPTTPTRVYQNASPFDYNNDR